MQAPLHFRSVRTLIAGALLCSGMVAGNAIAERPALIMLEPKSGQTVVSPFKVRMSVLGKKVHAAGKKIKGTGHFTLLIGHGAVGKGNVVPRDDTHLHYDKGETEAELTLPPGHYKLTAQFVDGTDHSFGHMLAHGINLTVE